MPNTSKQEVLVAKCSFVNVVNRIGIVWIRARFHHRSFKIYALLEY